MLFFALLFHEDCESASYQPASLRACESGFCKLRAEQFTSCELALQFVSCEPQLDQPVSFHRGKEKLIS